MTLKIGNDDLNPAAKLDHPARGLSEMALESILRFHNLAAIAVEVSLVGCAGLDHLLGQGRVQDGRGRVLVGNLLGCLRGLTLRCFEVGSIGNLEERGRPRQGVISGG